MLSGQLRRTAAGLSMHSTDNGSGKSLLGSLVLDGNSYDFLSVKCFLLIVFSALMH